MQKISLASACLNSKYCNVDRHVVKISNEEIQKLYLPINEGKSIMKRNCCPSKNFDKKSIDL